MTSLMHARLLVLLLAPIQWFVCWCYRFVLKIPNKILGFIASMLGIVVPFFGIFAIQCRMYTSLTGNIPKSDNYLMAILDGGLLVSAGIFFFSYYAFEHQRKGNRADSSDQAGTSGGASEVAGQGVGSSEVQMSQKMQWLWVACIVSLSTFVTRLYHEAQLSRLHLAIDQPYKMITLLVAGLTSGSVIALLRAYGIIKKE